MPNLVYWYPKIVMICQTDLDPEEAFHQLQKEYNALLDDNRDTMRMAAAAVKTNTDPVMKVDSWHYHIWQNGQIRMNQVPAYPGWGQRDVQRSQG